MEHNTVGEGWGEVGRSGFFTMALVIPVEPRFLWAPNKMPDKSLTGILRESMLATTMGPVTSGAGARASGPRNLMASLCALSDHPPVTT